MSFLIVIVNLVFFAIVLVAIAKEVLLKLQEIATGLLHGEHAAGENGAQSLDQRCAL